MGEPARPGGCARLISQEFPRIHATFAGTVRALRRRMTSRFLLLFPFATLFALAGCATEIDDPEQPSLVAPSDDTSVEPQARKCTTTRDTSDPNYVCYTTTCAKYVLIDCYPKKKAQ